jgi:hypothetical protein
MELTSISIWSYNRGNRWRQHDLGWSRAKGSVIVIVHTLPSNTPRPPIFRNSRVYVNILIPPSAAGRANGVRREFRSRRITVSGLDFDFLCDRTKGGCLLDLGIGLYPTRNVNATGLWRLKNFLQSFQYAGFRAPRIHQTDTFAHYGSMNAELWNRGFQ